jgi:hypothetical protein
MGVPPQEPQHQTMPLENLESLWDWRHASVDVWQPPLFDIMTGDASLAAATACKTAGGDWAPPLQYHDLGQQQQQELFGSCGLFDAGEDPESFLSTMVDMLVHEPKGM